MAGTRIGLASATEVESAERDGVGAAIGVDITARCATGVPIVARDAARYASGSTEVYEKRVLWMAKLSPECSVVDDPAESFNREPEAER